MPLTSCRVTPDPEVPARTPLSRRQRDGVDLARACFSTTTLKWILPFLLLPSFPRPSDAEALPPPDFTIAFLGDQDLGSDSEQVLEMIRDEGADAVVHSGDFDYDDDPQAWEDQINSILGPNFPYFASIGNHDDSVFYGAGGYQKFMIDRMERLGIEWDGDLGVQSAHRYAGIFFILTGPDVIGDGDGYHDVYIRDQLELDNSIWRISSWHKNMREMQVGGKSDATGWGVYEESRRGAAIIATAHEHSYSRTHLLSSMQSQTVASTDNTLRLSRDDPQTPPDEGRGFAFVSGLGGKSIRDQEIDGPWWASIYTSTQNADYGALFGVFHNEGDPRRAYFYFKDISGNVADAFFVESPPGLGPACTDGVDNDGDGLIDFVAGDPGCESALDESEKDETGSFPCDDGIDNDGDGRIDFDPVTIADPGGVGVLPAGVGDPSCGSPSWPGGERSQCADGVNNDGRPGIDWDGGFFFGLSGSADPQCNNPWDNREKRPGTCGLGFELALLLAPLGWMLGRRRRRVV